MHVVGDILEFISCEGSESSEKGFCRKALPIPRPALALGLFVNGISEMQHKLIHIFFSGSSGGLAGGAYHLSFATVFGRSGSASYAGDMIWTSYSLNTSWMLL